MQVAQLVSRTLERVYNSTALTFGIQDGADAGQTVQVCGCCVLWIIVLLPHINIS